MAIWQYGLLASLVLFTGLDVTGAPDPAEALGLLGVRGLDRKISAVEKKKLFARFAELDRNRDRRLSKSEAAAGESWLAQGDADGDGVVNRAEYLALRLVADEAGARLDALDRNRDGKTGREELLAGVGLDRQAGMERVFAALDADDNGSVTLEEALPAWLGWAREAPEHLGFGDYEEIASPNSGIRTSIRFENRRDHPVKAVWIDYAGGRVHYHDLPPGQSKSQNTYAEHNWLITDPWGYPLGTFRSTARPGVAIIVVKP